MAIYDRQIDPFSILKYEQTNAFAKRKYFAYHGWHLWDILTLLRKVHFMCLYGDNVHSISNTIDIWIFL